MPPADDALHRETRDMAVQALEVGRQAHERLDRQAEWMRAVDVRMEHLAEKIGKLFSEVASLKAKVAVGAAAGSILGALAAGIALKFIG